MGCSVVKLSVSTWSSARWIFFFWNVKSLGGKMIIRSWIDCKIPRQTILRTLQSLFYTCWLIPREFGMKVYGMCYSTYEREPSQIQCDSQHIRVARHKQEKPPDLSSQVPCAERGSTCSTCLRSPHSTRRNPRGFATRSASLTGSWPVSTPFTTFCAQTC